MLKVKTSMLIWDDSKDFLPENLEPKTFIIEGRSKGQLIDKLLYNLELCWAIMENNGEDGIDYHSIAKKSRNKHKQRKKII